MLKVSIVDDNELMLKDVAQRLSTVTEVKVTGVFSDGQQLLDSLNSCKKEELPDVILMDIEMPTNGIYTTSIVKSKFPSVDVIMLTVFDDDNTIYEAIKAGAYGYLLKEEPSSTIEKAVLDVKNGGSIISPSIARKIIRFLASTNTFPSKEKIQENPLSKRETEILELVANGFTNPQIADKLFISYETVRKHVRNIYEKLQVTNRTLATKKAIDNRWIKG
ncbi:MAG TPA: response regulator transcription factor [Tenuifilaceae bacterium]|nr:response regulator transcription factor [Tenuifilaceae bacterium]HPE19519.1 response regulator transcription factor [Tenuifilaceae bacterium]HPJ46837.1 response regulator transcription factor [Tenuifilaceae bacterium]HPQ35247.1 response regulator transcription factor [Tenuifilaceae bacterium]HRX69336.1 response regulator transcription factor [Tenuifilaceae bacterium]